MKKLLLGYFMAVSAASGIAVLTVAIAYSAAMHVQASRPRVTVLVVRWVVAAPKKSVVKNTPCVSQPTGASLSVGGLGDESVYRLPGAVRVNYDGNGLSQYLAPAGAGQVVGYYALQLAGQCWQLSALQPGGAVWQKGGKVLSIAAMENPVSGKSLVDYRVAYSQVLGETYQAAQTPPPPDGGGSPPPPPPPPPDSGSYQPPSGGTYTPPPPPGGNYTPPPGGDGTSGMMPPPGGQYPMQPGGQYPMQPGGQYPGVQMPPGSPYPGQYPGQAPGGYQGQPGQFPGGPGGPGFGPGPGGCAPGTDCGGQSGCAPGTDCGSGGQGFGPGGSGSQMMGPGGSQGGSGQGQGQWGGQGEQGQGQWQGPSQEEMDKMIKQQEEQQFKMMKQGVSQMERGMKQGLSQMKTGLKLMERTCGMKIPEAQAAMDAIGPLLQKVKDAQDMDALGDAFGAVQEAAENLETTGHNMQGYGQLCMANKEISRRIKTFTREVNGLAKKAANNKNEDIKALGAQLKAKFDELLALVKQEQEMKKSDPEKALELLEGSMEGLYEDVNNLKSAVQAALQGAQGLRTLTSDIKRFSRTIAAQKKAGKDVSEAEAQVAALQEAVAAAQATLKENPEEFVAALEDTFEQRNLVLEALGQVTGRTQEGFEFSDIKSSQKNINFEIQDGFRQQPSTGGFGDGGFGPGGGGFGPGGGGGFESGGGFPGGPSGSGGSFGGPAGGGFGPPPAGSGQTSGGAGSTGAGSP